MHSAAHAVFHNQTNTAPSLGYELLDISAHWLLLKGLLCMSEGSVSCCRTSLSTCVSFHFLCFDQGVLVFGLSLLEFCLLD